MGGRNGVAVDSGEGREVPPPPQKKGGGGLDLSKDAHRDTFDKENLAKAACPVGVDVLPCVGGPTPGASCWAGQQPERQRVRRAQGAGFQRVRSLLLRRQGGLAVYRGSIWRSHNGAVGAADPGPLTRRAVERHDIGPDAWSEPY